VVAPDSGAPAGAMMADTTHWTRNSAEHVALALQAYRLASMSVDAALAAGKPGDWAVIVDTDETLLDNSEYQKERGGLGWSADSWSAWTARKEAKALPGSVAFLHHVHELGGKVAVVTNRSRADCPATIENLDSAGLVHDIVLCQMDPMVSDKNPRFKAVEGGTAAAGIGPLKVVLWVGDNILDFPALDQEARNDQSRLIDFGSRMVIIPNPMYGSWTKNPRM
jgi:5'-nucleotidase (lipoprotein e(P4) family)